MKNIQDMTVREIQQLLVQNPVGTTMEYVLHISGTGMGLRKHYKGSSKNGTRVFMYDPYVWQGSKLRQQTKEDVQKFFEKTEQRRLSKIAHWTKQGQLARTMLEALNATQ